MNAPGPGRIDWKAERDRVDLVRVATDLLGPAPGRRGRRGPLLWWACPFHDDANPSFCVAPGRPRWKCHGCGEKGDAASLVMRLEKLTFREAVSRLVGGSSGATGPYPSPRRNVSPPPAGPQGLPLAEALSLIEEARALLWTAAGAEALDHLTRERRLTAETIRSARLGWTPRVVIPTKEGKCFPVRGITIPWHDAGRLALVKVRRPDGSEPKYAEAFRDGPSIFPTPAVAAVGRPLVVVEGEFDALLLGQELAGLASVATLGSASARPGPRELAALTQAAPWFIATDNDKAGDESASHWPGRSRRVRPPEPFKDWTEAAQHGIDLRRWWSDHLVGGESSRLVSWAEMSARRWAGADATPGIESRAEADTGPSVECGADPMLDSFLRGLAERRVSLRVEGDRLIYRGPRGSMLPCDRELLREHKGELMERIAADPDLFNPVAEADAPAWVGDSALSVSLTQIQESLAYYRASQAAEARLPRQAGRPDTPSAQQPSSQRLQIETAPAAGDTNP